MNAEATLKSLGITLPEAADPKAHYIPVRKVGNLVYVAGQGPIVNNEVVFTGKIGGDRTIEEGQEAARICGINLLAAAKLAVGSLDRIKSVVKVQAFVNSVAGFTQQHLVANGASDLFYSVFGEAGRHPRTAIGVHELPLDCLVEIEAIFEVE